jgi:hypothetical protein
VIAALAPPVLIAAVAYRLLAAAPLLGLLWDIAVLYLLMDSANRDATITGVDRPAAHLPARRHSRDL